MDLLERITGDRPPSGVTQEAYHLGPSERFGEVIGRSWARLTGAWRMFQDALDKLPESDAATSVTRERWLLPLFAELGFGRLLPARAIELDGRSYALSHAWQHTAIHLLGARVSLDRRTKGVAGASSASPHSLVQDLLNRSDAHLWAFVSNGLALRLLRDSKSLTRQAYVEFDLQAIFADEQFAEFRLLWLLCHQSRVEADKPEACWLEQWFQGARTDGVRALDKLRAGVEGAIEALGRGFLRARDNRALHDALASGALDTQQLYRELLRLVYRLIFLFVAEDRGALIDPGATAIARERFARHFSTTRLRALAERHRGSHHVDLYRGLRLTLGALREGCPGLGLPALGSFLFGPDATPHLDAADLRNEDLLAALRSLSFVADGPVRRPVSWQNLGAEELGSIYEALLEQHPTLEREAVQFKLGTAAGHERKTTGSYYTPASLVDCLLDSALDPVLDEAARKPTAAEAERALLDLKVCDPACGSGHFLVAAARRIARRLATIRTGDDEPSPEAQQAARRDVVGRCLYGVDLNPMAVELCKISLWMEAIEPGKPLSFLDSHIQCGNALLGTTPALLLRRGDDGRLVGIPDEAIAALEGDDKKVTTEQRKRNQAARKQPSLFSAAGIAIDFDALRDRMRALDAESDATLADVARKSAAYDAYLASPAYRHARLVADAWCAAFVWLRRADIPPLTNAELLPLLETGQALPPAVRAEVERLARQYAFFHWHLAFPEVFDRSGVTTVGRGLTC